MSDRNLCASMFGLAQIRLCAMASSLRRAAPIFLLSVASLASAAPARFDAQRAPAVSEVVRTGLAEMITSGYEPHQPTNTSRNQAFGVQVAVSGDGETLAVADIWYSGGSEWPWYGSGAVYVYGRSDGQWLLQAKLEPTDPRGYDFFGSDLALSADGRTLAIGSQYEGYDAPSQAAGPGSVFVFTRRGGVWSQHALLKATNPQDAASFGRSVEISRAGDVLAIGAPYESANVESAQMQLTGAVYVFRREGDVWRPQAALQAPTPESYDLFGLGVRLSKDGRTLAVLAGEQNEMTEDLDNGGWRDRNNTVYVFVFARAAGGWSQQAEIEGSSDEPMLGGDGYDQEGQIEGFDLSADGRTLAIASPFAMGSDQGAGMIRLYERSGDHWAPSGVTLTPSLPDRLSFGLRLALSGDGRTLVATADRDDGPYGRPYVIEFSRGNGQWSQAAVLESPAWPAYTSFGNSLTLSRNGERLAIGSRSYATETSSWGVVFVY